MIAKVVSFVLLDLVCDVHSIDLLEVFAVAFAKGVQLVIDLALL